MITEKISSGGVLSGTINASSNLTMGIGSSNSLIGGNINTFTKEIDPTIPDYIKEISEEDIAGWDNNAIVNEEQNKTLVGLEELIDTITPKAPPVKGELVYITDALPLPIFENKVDGKAEQETTKGNQLMDFNITPSLMGSTATFENDILTIATSSGYDYTGARYKSDDLIEILRNNAGKQIWFKFDNIEFNETKGAVIRLEGTGLTGQLYAQSTNEFTLFTIPETIPDNLVLRFITYNATASTECSMKITKPILYIGTEAKPEYEKYTGAEATPNPNYKQPIKVLEGYNELPVTKWVNNNSNIYTNVGITGTIYEDGTIELKGTNTATTQTNFTILSSKTFFEHLLNKNVRVALTNAIPEGMALQVYDDSYTVGVYMSKNKLSATYNMSKITTGIYFTIQAGATIDYKTKLMLHEGTEDKPYLPYGSIGIKKHKKNFINPQKMYENMSYNLEVGTIRKLKERKFEYAISDENGVINFSSGSYDWANFTIKSDTLPIGKYILNVEREYGSLPGGTSVYICEELDDNQYKVVSKLYASQLNNNLAIPQNLDLTIENKNRCVIVTFANNKITENASVKLKVQLEPGEIITSYEPYQEQIVYLDLKGNWAGAINDTIKDYLVTDKKKFWLVKNVGLKEYAEENIRMVTSHTYDNIDYARIYKPDDYIGNNSYDIIEVKYDKAYWTYVWYDFPDAKNIGRIISTASRAEFWIGFPKGTTEQEMKTRLSNSKLFYPLAEPQIIELGELPEPIKTFEGTNNIQVLANLDTEIEVKYALDVKKYADDRYLELTNALVSTGANL